MTAGNSSGMNDAAAALVMMSEDKCNELGLKPLAYVDGYAAGGVDPRVMGYGRCLLSARYWNRAD